MLLQPPDSGQQGRRLLRRAVRVGLRAVVVLALGALAVYWTERDTPARLPHTLAGWVAASALMAVILTVWTLLMRIPDWVLRDDPSDRPVSIAPKRRAPAGEG